MARRPLSQRGDADSDYDALHEGVPSWLVESVRTWLRPHLTTYWTDAYGRRKSGSDTRLIREIERTLRISIGQASNLRDRLLAIAEANDVVMLDLLDFVVNRVARVGGPPPLEDLDAYLSEAGSVWRVAHYSDHVCLERRVDDAVTTTAHDVMSTAGRAGRHLMKAWNETYGRNPSSSEAYREAVRAVEVAAIPVVIPNDPSATLGKVIAAMRDAPDKWAVALAPSDGSDPVEAVRHMCELLWKSQWDRHGIPDESAPLDASPEEAVAAVHLATTLVQWFTASTVQRR